LAEIADHLPTPRNEAVGIREKMDAMKKKMRELADSGNRADATKMIPELKQLSKNLNEIFANNPGLKEQIEQGVEPPAAQKKASSKKLDMSIEEIYDVYHNADDIVCMSVIEKEIARCQGLTKTLKD